MKYINLINSFYPSLSKGEKKVADYVLEVRSGIMYQSLQEVSKTVGVGEATIIRFCQKIGFAGFHYFKLSIEKHESAFSEEDKKDIYVDLITDNIQNALKGTKSILNMKNIELSIDMIANAKRVFIYGVGTSGNAAIDMQSRLLRYGKTSSVIIDSHFQMMTASVMNKDDLLIVFSLSGYTKEIYEAITLAKTNSTKVISITNHTMSKVAEVSDVVVLSAGKESPMDGGSLSGRISQLYIIDIICTGYALSNKDVANEMREKTANSVLAKSLEYKNKTGGKNGKSRA